MKNYEIHLFQILGTQHGTEDSSRLSVAQTKV